MSWINEEAAKARQHDEDKARQDEAYRQQVPGLWNGLRHFLAQDVEKINANEDLVELKLGGAKLHFQEDGDGTKIIKDKYPAIYLTVNNRGRYIEIERKIVTNGENRKTRTEREVFDIVMDNDHLQFKNDHGMTFGVADASQSILTPLLRTDLIK